MERWAVGRATIPPERRERAVRMVVEVRPDYSPDWPAIVAVASWLGYRVSGDAAETGPPGPGRGSASRRHGRMLRPLSRENLRRLVSAPRVFAPYKCGNMSRIRSGEHPQR